MINDNFRGFSLFNDIEDVELKNRNRAVILTNMAEDNMDRKTKKINMKGTTFVLGYFNLIPEEERADVKNRFMEGMAQRGFILA